MLSDLSGFAQGDERSGARRDADVVNDDRAGLEPVEPQPNRSKLRSSRPASQSRWASRRSTGDEWWWLTAPL